MKTALLTALLLVSFAIPAFADDPLTDLRCKSGLIMVGETKLEVVSRCGEPAGKSTVERRLPRTVKPTYVTIEEWTYNFGPSDFIHVLEFEGSTLKAIRRGSRGF